MAVDTPSDDSITYTPDEGTMGYYASSAEKLTPPSLTDDSEYTRVSASESIATISPMTPEWGNIELLEL